MNATTPVLHNRIDAVLALAAARLDPLRAKRVEALAPEYFRRLDAQDLADRMPEDLLGALVAHLELGEQRERGQTKVRIFNPSSGDGWPSRHTVIQIVNDDMPFLVDSTSLEVNRQGFTLHLIIHPIFAVERDTAGVLKQIVPRAQAPQDARESWMHVEVDRIIDADQQQALQSGIERVLADVRHAVQDWRPMLARLEIAIAELANPPATVPQAMVDESRAFLQWLAEGHLTLLGYRQHELVQHAGEAALRVLPGTGLGLLRDAAHDLSATLSLIHI